jgi:hypothetical protein
MCYGFVNMIGDFSPVWHRGVGNGGGQGGGGVQATYIVLPRTLHVQTHNHTYIHLSVYLFIDLLIYLPCFDTFCSFLGLGVSY